MTVLLSKSGRVYLVFVEIGNPFKPISSEVDQPVAMLVAVGAGAVVSELVGMGIEQHDPVNKFWEVYGERMKNVFPEMAGCAATITPQIMEHGIITVGGMLTLSVGEMEECITNGGGRAKWTKGVMNLLGRSTSQCGNISTQSRMIPPPSASLLSLASSSSTNEEHKKDQAYKPAYPNDKLGVRLLQNGTLDACIIPKERLLAAVTETKDPHINTLSYNDCSAVMAVVFAFIFTKYGNVGGCGTLFDALEKQLDVRHGGLFARPHGKKSFRDKIVNRFKTGRRAGQTLELDQSQADETCEDGMQIMRMGMHIKIKKEAPTWPKSQWGEALERENLSENVSNQAAHPAPMFGFPEEEQDQDGDDEDVIANEEGERVILDQARCQTFLALAHYLNHEPKSLVEGSSPLHCRRPEGSSPLHCRPPLFTACIGLPAAGVREAVHAKPAVPAPLAAVTHDDDSSSDDVPLSKREGKLSRCARRRCAC